MKLYEYNEANWQVEFIYSPYLEILCSLHVEGILRKKEMEAIFTI